MPKFVAVQTLNSIVFGIGDSEQSALADAATWANDVSALTVYPSTPRLAAYVETTHSVPTCEIVNGVAQAVREND